MSRAYRSEMSDNDARAITKPPPAGPVRDTEYIHGAGATWRLGAVGTGPMPVVGGSAR